MIIKLGLYMLSMVFIFEHMLKSEQEDLTRNGERFEFWIRLEVLAFTANIVSHIFSGFIRLFDHG